MEDSPCSLIKSSSTISIFHLSFLSSLRQATDLRYLVRRPNHSLSTHTSTHDPKSLLLWLSHPNSLSPSKREVFPPYRFRNLYEIRARYHFPSASEGLEDQAQGFLSSTRLLWRGGWVPWTDVRFSYPLEHVLCPELRDSGKGGDKDRDTGDRALLPLVLSIRSRCSA